MMKAGTMVVCPDCKEPQIRSTANIQAGGQIKEGCWESLGFDMTSLRMGCHSCGTSWHRFHPKTREPQIHTKEDGWVSLTKSPSTRKPMVEM